MTSLADYVAATSPVEQVTHDPKPPKSTHPRGWEPGVVWSGAAGVGISEPVPFDGSEVSHAELLKQWGFDPDKYQIEGPLEYRQWDASTAEGLQTMRYYKAKIAVRSFTSSMASIDELVKRVKGHKKAKASPPVGEDGFVVALADWQLGKEDINGGTAGTTDKILAMIDSVEDRVRELRKSGRPLGTLYVLGLGDMIERCTGFYANQEWKTDLTEAEQTELAVHLIVTALKQWSPLFDKVVVGVVVGNHGENRKDGKPNTDRIRDNADTMVFKFAAKVLAENPERYGHVSFVMPKDRSTMVLNIAGITVGIAHGNQYGSSANAFKTWWERQTLGYQPMGEAHIMLTGHYHHLKIDQYGSRTHIQVPAMDPGSLYFSEGCGLESPSGTVTFSVNESGWADLQVIA